MTGKVQSSARDEDCTFPVVVWQWLGDRLWRDSVTLISTLLLTNVDTRRRLRSADLAMLVVPSTRRSTLGDRAFPVASARAWNSLPSSVRNAPSLTTFHRELKTVLFQSNCFLPATTDCQWFYRFVCFSFLFNFVRASAIRECDPGTPPVFKPVNPGLCAVKTPGFTGLI